MLGEYCLCNPKQVDTFTIIDRFCREHELTTFLNPNRGSSELDIIILNIYDKTFRCIFKFDALEKNGVKLGDAIEMAIDGIKQRYDIGGN